ncbi:hypothetical protein HZY88_01740 [Aerococcaceae bacterium DSM 111176]|nr:hypothetical protein [Aerococcaceae bacterium DSM 111176]
MIKKKILLLSGLLVVLAGCGEAYESFIDEQAQELASSQAPTETSSESNDEATVDERIIPEFNQLESAILNSEQVTITEPVYRAEPPYVRDIEGVVTTIENINVYEVDEADEELMKDFNFEDEPGAIVYMYVTMANQRSEDISVPIQNFRLSYLNASQQSYPSSDLYFLPNGNLSSIMANAGNILPADSRVEGYLAFGIGEEMYEAMDEIGYYTLNTEYGLASGSTFTDMVETSIYLPLNEEAREVLNNNEQMLPDRLTTELWGEKTILADDQLNDSEEDDDVTVSLDHIQVTDFEPFEEYESVFENFPYGQVIVTTKFTVTNNSDEVIMPIDGQISLMIGEDEILDDYVLIDQLYGERLEPGESVEMIRSFALDKMRYYDIWQGEDMAIYLSLPTLTDLNEDDEAEEDESGEESEEMTEESTSQEEEDLVIEDDAFLFQWLYTPNLVRYVNEDMDIVEEGMEENETSSEEDGEVDDADEEDIETDFSEDETYEESSITEEFSE